MSDTITRTQNGSLFDTWTGDSHVAESGATLRPRLRVLYHVDIDRIGAVSLPNPALESGAWMVVGRREPLFVDPRPEGLERPLDDPTVSRDQLMIRWLAEDLRFEVQRPESSRRRVGVLDLDGEEGDWDESGVVGGMELTGTVRLAPGSCLVIEGRVLLGLEVVSGPFEGPSAARLGLVGESEVMWQLRRDILEVAEFRHPALLLGPTGAGKEVVAHAIHEHSARARSAFVTVNCAALPEHLVESLLFGHKKGAFTGADHSAPGRFRAADQGTLFLDELGEMPLHVQPKLLRAVQDGKVAPVGEHGTVDVDVRLIAATNRDPVQEIEGRRLREDLFHRLSAHILHLPPLVERRFDIPELFMHFLRRLRAEHEKLDWLWEGGRQWRRTIPMSFMVDLMSAPWLGNVRELQNVAARMARRNLTAGAFQAPAISASRSSHSELTVVPRPAVAPTSPQAGSGEHDLALLGAASEVLDLAHKTVAKLISPAELEDLMKRGGGEATEVSAELSACASERLLALLTAHEFRQRAVAAELDVSPSTLIKLMQQFSIPRPSDLSLVDIESTIDAVGGDVELAARQLKVSSQGLRKRLTLLRLKGA